MTLNSEQAQYANEQLTTEAMREQIREALQACKMPVTVAHIVKQTGFDAIQVRDIVLDMVAEGEVKERAWMYTL